MSTTPARAPPLEGVARTRRNERVGYLGGRARDLAAERVGVEHLADQHVVIVRGGVVLIVVRRSHCARWISTTSERGKSPLGLSSGSGSA